MKLLDDARAIAKKYDLDGVLIIGISLPEDALPSASYGRNAVLCKRFGGALDLLLEELTSGRIHIR